MDGEVLRKMREIVVRKVERATSLTDDEWMYMTKDLLPLYLQLHILDKLESIEERLSSMSNDSWTDHHEKGGK